MAKVVVEFDTEEKTATFKVGGKAVEDVSSFTLYKKYAYLGDNDGDEDDEYYMDISIMEDEEDGMRHHSRICASQIADAKGLVSADTNAHEVPEVSGYIAFATEGSPANSTLVDEIASYLASRRK